MEHSFLDSHAIAVLLQNYFSIPWQGKKNEVSETKSALEGFSCPYCIGILINTPLKKNESAAYYVLHFCSFSHYRQESGKSAFAWIWRGEFSLLLANFSVGLLESVYNLVDLPRIRLQLGTWKKRFNVLLVEGFSFPLTRLNSISGPFAPFLSTPSTDPHIRTTQ